MSRKNIADTLKSSRKNAKMSVETVCERLKSYDIEISTKTLYNYETAFRQPDADTLMALCDIYGITDILGTFGYKKEEPTVNNSELSDEEKVFTSLPPEMRQEVLRYMQYLAEQQDRLE